MNKLIMIFFFVITSLGAYSQVTKDVINLKDGKTIKCTITAIDTLSRTISYRTLESVLAIPLNKVASYTWNGIVNAGLPTKKAVSLPIEILPQEQSNVQDAGSMIVKFSDQAQTGLGLMIAGNVISITSVFIKNESDLAKETNTRNLINAVGVGVSLVGTIVFISSFNQSRKAGQLLKIKDNIALGIGDNGIGFTVKL